MAETVGIIGYGQMGKRMGQRLLDAGYSLWAHDLQPEALELARQAGANPAPSIEALTAACSVIITMLPGPPEVEAVILGSGGILEHAKPDTLLLEMSSSYPPVTRRICDQVRASGLEMLDAPVSGGIQGAEAGTLTVMVGGEVALLARARPVLEIIGKNVVHVGPIGSGHALKALNNLLAAVMTAATAEVTTLAVRSGIDATTALDVFSISSGRSRATDYMFPTFVLPRTFDAGFTLGLLKKDTEIATRLARELDHPMLVGNITREVLGLATQELGAQADYTSLVKLYEQWTGVEVKGTA